MKKRTNKKLLLNKQRISELSQGNMENMKGGSGTTGVSFHIACIDTLDCPQTATNSPGCGGTGPGTGTGTTIPTLSVMLCGG